MGHSGVEAQEEFKSALFTPLKIGSLTLTHRVVLAPLTRMRASVDGVPTPLAAEYYGQRATKGGLLIAEATNISQQATGYCRTPGIYTDAQIEAWKPVTRAVRAKGGHIFLQLWHVGRVSHSKIQHGGQLPVAPSAIAIPGKTFLNDGTMPEFEVPHELRAEDEIPAIVEDYRRAAKNAFLAGFDGVEVHSANGYLIDQFLHNGSNQRTDKYGGSIENRSRFLFEVLAGVQQAWKEAVGESSPQAKNVGVRLGPFGTFNNMSDSEEDALFRHVIAKLNDNHLAYIHVIEPRVQGTTMKDETAPAEVVHTLCRLFKGPVISAGGYKPESAHNTVHQAGKADPPLEVAVAFGRIFIANPDLPLKIFLRTPLANYDRATFYTLGEVGYTDQSYATQEAIQAGIEDLRRQFPENQKLQHDINNYVELLKA